MSFEKGNKYGNTSTREGIQNKATSEVRRSFQSLIENNLEQMQADLLGINAEARLNVIIKLAGFILPKLQAVEIDATHESVENSDLIKKLLLIDDKKYE